MGTIHVEEKGDAVVDSGIVNDTSNKMKFVPVKITKEEMKSDVNTLEEEMKVNTFKKFGGKINKQSEHIVRSEGNEKYPRNYLPNYLSDLSHHTETIPIPSFRSFEEILRNII